MMRCASPSTIAVLPTPGSPISAGLFLVRRERIWITRSISVCGRSPDRACRPRPSRSGRSPARPGTASCSGAGCEPERARWPSARCPTGALAQHAHHLGAHLLQGDAHDLQHAGGHALAIAHQAEQQMLGADIVMVQSLAPLRRRTRSPSWRARSDPDPGARPFAVTDDELDRAARLRKLHPEIVQHARGDALALPDQAQQNMLGADIRMVEVLASSWAYPSTCLARLVNLSSKPMVVLRFGASRVYPSDAPRSLHATKVALRLLRRTGEPQLFCTVYFTTINRPLHSVVWSAALDLRLALCTSTRDLRHYWPTFRVSSFEFRVNITLFLIEISGDNQGVGVRRPESYGKSARSGCRRYQPLVVTTAIRQKRPRRISSATVHSACRRWKRYACSGSRSSSDSSISKSSVG